MTKKFDEAAGAGNDPVVDESVESFRKRLPAKHPELIRMEEKRTALRREMDRVQQEIDAERLRISMVGARLAGEESIHTLADAVAAVDAAIAAGPFPPGGQVRIEALERELAAFERVFRETGPVYEREAAKHDEAIRRVFAPRCAAIVRAMDAHLQELVRLNEAINETRSVAPGLMLGLGRINIGDGRSTGRYHWWRKAMKREGWLK